jgi:hypothetical protein
MPGRRGNCRNSFPFFQLKLSLLLLTTILIKIPCSRPGLMLILVKKQQTFIPWNHADKGDIAITHDIGPTSLLLSKKVNVLPQKGIFLKKKYPDQS